MLIALALDATSAHGEGTVNAAEASVSASSAPSRGLVDASATPLSARRTGAC